jgi:2-aminoadipate transaminase
MDPSDLLSARARSSTSSVIRDLLRLVDRPDMLSLAGGLPAAEFLPVERLAEAMERVVSPRALQYGPTEGMLELREVVAARLGARADELVVCTGSQQGLDLVARTLVDPGDVVVIEAPSYLGTLQSIRANGATIHAVPGDRSGMRIDVLEEDLAAGLRPKLVSVVTDFANPSGATLALDRRHALVELADRYGFVVVEDDPYGELRWAGERLPSLGEIAASGGGIVDRIVTLGSASKVLAPGLRLGWLRGPDWLVEAVVKLKQSADLHTSSLDQLLAADVLGDTAFMEHHLDRIRSEYRTRSAALVDAIADRCGHLIEAPAPDGGMFVWGRLTDGSSSSDLFDRAIRAGVSFVPGAAFAPDGSADPHLRMCFTTLRPDLLDQAVERLAKALAG